MRKVVRRHKDGRLDAFHVYLEDLGKSENTIRAYLYAVKQFYELYHKLTPTNLKLYKTYLIENYTPATANLRIRAINSYLESIEIESSPISMIKFQKKSFLEHMISNADYEHLKKSLLNDNNLTYYYIVRFLASTGARISEVVMFRVEDVKYGYKDIVSKANKGRRIYIPEKLKQDALSWLEHENRTTGPLFINRYGRPLTSGAIRSCLYTLADKYGLPREVIHPHSFRHRFAINFLNNYNDIALLADLLGHDSIETTRIYLTRTSSEQKQLIDTIVNW